MQEFDSFNSKSEYLDSAYVYLSRMDLEIKENFFLYFFQFFINSFKNIIDRVQRKGIDNVLSMFSKKQYNNFDALTCYRIGRSFYRLEDYNNALYFLINLILLLHTI